MKSERDLLAWGCYLVALVTASLAFALLIIEEVVVGVHVAAITSLVITLGSGIKRRFKIALSTGIVTVLLLGWCWKEFISFV